MAWVPPNEKCKKLTYGPPFSLSTSSAWPTSKARVAVWGTLYGVFFVLTGLFATRAAWLLTPPVPPLQLSSSVVSTDSSTRVLAGQQRLVQEQQLQEPPPQAPPLPKHTAQQCARMVQQLWTATTDSAQHPTPLETRISANDAPPFAFFDPITCQDVTTSSFAGND
jgi:hypothetical protein